MLLLRRCIPPITGKSKTHDPVPSKHVETSTQKFQEMVVSGTFFECWSFGP